MRSQEIPAEVVNLLVFMEDFIMYSELPRKVSFTLPCYFTRDGLPPLLHYSKTNSLVHDKLSVELDQLRVCRVSKGLVGKYRVQHAFEPTWFHYSRANRKLVVIFTRRKSSMIGAKLASWPHHFNFLKMAANKSSRRRWSNW